MKKMKIWLTVVLVSFVIASCGGGGSQEDTVVDDGIVSEQPKPPVDAPETPEGVKPAKPDGLSITVGDAQVTIGWNAVNGATSYNVYWGNDADSIQDNKIADVTSPYQHAGLTNGTTYYYAVAAENENGEGLFSDVVSAIPNESLFPKLWPSNSNSNVDFGISVAISGEYIVVGAPAADVSDTITHAGLAYIYHCSNNSCDKEWRIEASDAKIGDNFGYSVAIDGEYAVVGASGGGSLAEGLPPTPGAAYVFHLVNGEWGQEAKLAASDAQDYDYFGLSVAIYENDIVVSAINEDGGDGDPFNRAGAAYVFTREGSSWNEKAKLMASDAQEDDWFGYSVGISKDDLVVGSYGATAGDADPVLRAGAAYMFHRANNVWTEQAKLTVSDAHTYDHFGRAVSIDGDYVVGGIHFMDGKGTLNTGAAYVFHRVGDTWTEEAKLVSSDAQVGDWFGDSVSIRGDYIIAGASGESGGDGDPLPDTGAAYIFHRTDAGWAEEQKLGQVDARKYSYFGDSVAIGEDLFVVGATEGDNPILSDTGTAYLFPY